MALISPSPYESVNDIESQPLITTVTTQTTNLQPRIRTQPSSPQKLNILGCSVTIEMLPTILSMLAPCFAVTLMIGAAIYIWQLNRY